MAEQNTNQSAAPQTEQTLNQSEALVLKYKNAIIACVCGIIAIVLHFLQSIKLSKAFGHGAGLGLVLFFLGPIGRLILGFGRSEYAGQPD